MGSVAFECPTPEMSGSPNENNIKIKGSSYPFPLSSPMASSHAHSWSSLYAACERHGGNRILPFRYGALGSDCWWLLPMQVGWGEGRR